MSPAMSRAMSPAMSGTMSPAMSRAMSPATSRAMSPAMSGTMSPATSRAMSPAMSPAMSRAMSGTMSGTMSGAMNGRCSKTMERSVEREVAQRERSGERGYRNRWSAERLFSPLTLRSHALITNKCQNFHVSVCSEFSQLCFCQILFELVCSWESYHKNKKGKVFIETQCIITLSCEEKWLWLPTDWQLSTSADELRHTRLHITHAQQQCSLQQTQQQTYYQSQSV